MGSPWTDKSAILRDLSVAQGRRVPGGIGSPVAGAKPPVHNIKEETEEEYYRRWGIVESGGCGDFSAGPDLFKIKKMLELVHGDDTPDDEMMGEEMSAPIEIRKLNPAAVQFVPKIKKTAKENVKPIGKPRRARNVAIASIMALASQLTQEPIKLAKPEDFMKPSKETEELKDRRKDSVNKVTNWLQSQDITAMFKKKSSITEQSSSPKESLKSQVLSEHSVKSPKGNSQSPTGTFMFQYKVKSPKCSEASVKSPNGEENSAKSPNGKGNGVRALNGYTPTAWAEEYYKKAVDRSLVRDLVRDDVWGRAERVMKEIDAQKEELRKAEVAAALEAEIARQCDALESMTLADLETATDLETAKDLETANGLENDAESSSSQAMDAKVEGIAHILLPKSRHELFPATPCVVCHVLSTPGTAQEKGPPLAATS